jgi:gas vesicle protein
MPRNDSSEKILWFAAGAALGATIALLYAPNSGEETRRRIGKAARTGADKVAESGRHIAELGKELYERGREIAEDAAEMFERGKELIDRPEMGEEA